MDSNSSMRQDDSSAINSDGGITSTKINERNKQFKLKELKVLLKKLNPDNMPKVELNRMKTRGNSKNDKIIKANIGNNKVKRKVIITERKNAKSQSSNKIKVDLGNVDVSKPSISNTEAKQKVTVTEEIKVKKNAKSRNLSKSKLDLGSVDAVSEPTPVRSNEVKRKVTVTEENKPKKNAKSQNNDKIKVDLSSVDAVSEPSPVRSNEAKRKVSVTEENKPKKSAKSRNLSKSKLDIGNVDVSEPSLVSDNDAKQKVTVTEENKPKKNAKSHNNDKIKVDLVSVDAVSKPSSVSNKSKKQKIALIEGNKLKKKAKSRNLKKIKIDLGSVDTVSEPSSSKDSSTNSHDSSSKFVSAVRKRLCARVLKRGTIRKRKVRPNVKRLKKTKKVVDNNRSYLNNDESTSNSENSENANLFSDINWEENLEVASDELVEEFAPRPSMISQKANKTETKETVKEKLAGRLKPAAEDEKSKTKIDKYKAEGGNQEVKVKLDQEAITSATSQLSYYENVEQEFSTGLQIYVKDYQTTEWNKASIVEVDWEEEEVLVHYENDENLDIKKPDEWVSMSSQRLSRSSAHPQTLPKVEENVVDMIKPEEIKTEIPSEDEELASEISEPNTVTTTSVPSPSTVQHRRNRNKFRGFRSTRKNWRFKRQISTDINKKFQGKFKIGEKVLAKWSNHRMQKFPAVIKSISGTGAYDLLFYDGFEKTINEDHIYKTTEEEAAKYQDSKPSEADSFVDMDADSKEARRQRKKKTFDDYVFSKDLMQRKKRTKSNEDEASSSGKKSILQSLHTSTHSRRGRKRKKLISEGKEDEEGVLSPVNDNAENNECDNSNLAGTDSDNYHELLGESEDRWTGEIPPDVKPLNIECTDGIRKSVVVPDKVLPIGWTKQCINRTGQMWETFLISPEGYRLNTTQDLKEYSRQILGSRTPRNLDFLVNTDILPGLIDKQEHLQPVNNWLPWLSKTGKKKLVTGTSVMSPFAAAQHQQQQQQVVGTGKVGRVRTLLPKTRTIPAITSTGPPAATFSEIWRCPKQGCNKKFRKENLLQMHIKHYHVEFTALVGNAPNVVDLACARSESVNAEHIKSPVPLSTKKLLSVTKLSSQTPPHVSESLMKPTDIDNLSTPINAPLPQMASVIRAEPNQEILVPNKATPEERKTTIKTMLPLRQPVTGATVPMETLATPRPSAAVDSDDFGSDDGQSLETKLLSKPGRGRKKSEKKLSIGNRPDDIPYPMSPTNKNVQRKKLPILDKLQITTDSNDSYTEEEKTSPNTEVTTDEGCGVVIERLKSEEIINCICGYREEDGLMIQCDICMCWQHGQCSGVETDSDVPDRYVCYICRHPAKVRSSKKYSYALNYLSQGKLPSFSFRSKDEKEVQQRELVLKRCYELSASLRQIQNVERSLKAKINIAEQAGHPKLYLWAKSWDETNQVNTKVKDELVKEEKPKEENDGNEESSEADKPKENQLSNIPEPEAPIDLEECRIKLLDHIDNYYQQLDDRLMSLQTQIAALESQDADLSSNVVPDKTIKQTLQMLLRDLKTVQKIAAVSS